MATDNLIGASLITSRLMCSFSSAVRNKSDNRAWMAAFRLTSSRKVKADNFMSLIINSLEVLSFCLWANFMASTTIPSSTYSFINNFSTHVNLVSLARWPPQTLRLELQLHHMSTVLFLLQTGYRWATSSLSLLTNFSILLGPPYMMKLWGSPTGSWNFLSP